jgi:hypothetical protein
MLFAVNRHSEMTRPMNQPLCDEIKKANQRSFEDAIKEGVDEQLKIALDCVFREKHSPIGLEVHERSICFRLAFYLQHLFPEFAVDCEYNHNCDENNEDKRKAIFALVNDLHAFKKKLKLPPDEVTQVSVFPDIIVHRRETNENLLILEAKKDYGGETSDYDKFKLFHYQDQLNYKFARMVTFHKRGADKPFTIEEG